MPTRWLGCLVIVAIALLSAAAQWALSSVQESAAFELESLAIAASSQPCAGASSCHAAGYCDRSVGRCICLPGWTGARCDATLLGACRMGEHGIAAPCEGFAGVMSCQCRQACSVLHAVYGTNAPARSGADKAVCWTSDASDELDTSSLPPNASVHFWAPHRNWQVNRGADRMQFVQHRTAGWAKLRYSADVPVWGPVGITAKSMLRLSSILARRAIPVARCPRSCSLRGSCFLREAATAHGLPASGRRNAPRNAPAMPALTVLRASIRTNPRVCMAVVDTERARVACACATRAVGDLTAH